VPNRREQPRAVLHHAIGDFAYYAETLGLAALPWIAVVPIAIWSGLRAFARRSAAEDERREEAELGAAALHRFAILWFVGSLLAISYSSTKHYHYLLPCLPPLSSIRRPVDRSMARLPEPPSRGSAIVVGMGVGLALVVVAWRDPHARVGGSSHRYLYRGFWNNAPDPHRLIITWVPFAVGLLVCCVAASRRARRFACAGWLISGLLTTTYVIADYLPAASESWSQRAMMQV
jgi:4-amino-4-deoxy-L-arabinose transferase-like glycosyltransferase